VRASVHNYLQTAKEVNHYYPQLWQLVESGAFKIHIYKEYTFTQEGVAEAQTEQASGKTTGKLVIKVAD
jgi:NADPH2:quinone reductase